MNHRERVMTALEHKEPDLLPLDFGSTPTSTITKGAYTRLRTYLGMEEKPIEFFNFAAQSVVPDEEVLRRFCVDTRAVSDTKVLADSVSPERVEGYDEFTDAWGIRHRKPATGGFYYDPYGHPLRGKNGDEIGRYPLPDPKELVNGEALRQRCITVRENGFPVVLGKGFAFGLMHTGAYLLGYEDFLSRMILERRLVESLLEKILYHKLVFYEHVLQAAGEYIDIVVEADALGTQRGPFISPDLYRTMIKPLQAKLFRGIKQMASHVKILYHSDGSIYEFIPDLIEIGADALNPVQISADRMNPELLKSEFGSEITFWGGGIDTQEVLPKGDIEAIRRSAERLISVFSKNGGYVFSTVHNIQDDVAPEHIVALFDEVNKGR